MHVFIYLFLISETFCGACKYQQQSRQESLLFWCEKNNWSSSQMPLHLLNIGLQPELFAAFGSLFIYVFQFDSTHPS